LALTRKAAAAAFRVSHLLNNQAASRSRLIAV
jgi:hypothetical protein